MRLLELGMRMVAGYSVFSLLLGLSVIHMDSGSKTEPFWTNFRESAAIRSGVLPSEKRNISAVKPPVIKKESFPLEKTADSDLESHHPPEKERATVEKARDIIGNRNGKTSSQVASRFFPSYGTGEFLQKCGWTFIKPQRPIENCTFLARPQPDTGEGISHWLGSQITGGYMFSIQTGCKFFLDYGPGIDVHQVITPHATMSDGDIQAVDWTVPDGFVCNETNPGNCFLPRPTFSGQKHLQQIQDALHVNSLAQVPDYRFAYKYSRDTFLRTGAFKDLQRALPGLQLDTAMACSLASLFRLAPSAVHYEPRLYSEILPTLYQEDALVLALYIRSGFTDKQANQEKEGKVARESSMPAKRYADKIISCAVGLEQEYLANNTLAFSRVVWMVVSDSQLVKQYVSETYDSRNVNTTTTLPRHIVTTSSRGVHSRASRDPSTRDFAEAFIDWYLIGESHAVIADQIMSPSFGDTAALRTARPLYKVISGIPSVCQRVKLFDAVKRTVGTKTTRQAKRNR